ncbi:MAG: hypothetical protein KDB22_23935 [Planctomycetales bacterium]|nr:hypothetical protein [Planctomycetales bacterium]
MQSMFESLRKTWKANHCNLLLTLGAVAAILMSAVWYSKLLPTVELISEGSISDLVQPTRVQGLPLVVVISGPKRGESQELTYTGEVRVFSADGKLGDSVPLSSSYFELDTSGFATVILPQPRARSIAICAYLDTNSNGNLDFANGNPSEPFRLTPRPSADPRSLDLEDAAIPTPQAGPIHFQFPMTIKTIVSPSKPNSVPAKG